MQRYNLSKNWQNNFQKYFSGKLLIAVIVRFTSKRFFVPLGQNCAKKAIFDRKKTTFDTPFQQLLVEKNDNLSLVNIAVMTDSLQFTSIYQHK